VKKKCAIARSNLGKQNCAFVDRVGRVFGSVVGFAVNAITRA